MDNIQSINTFQLKFPTGIYRRDDLGLPDRFDVYYGMADNRIGVVHLDLPGILPTAGVTEPPEGAGRFKS